MIKIYTGIIQRSREEFENSGKRDMEAALAESLEEYAKKQGNSEEIIEEYGEEEVNDDINQVIASSKEEFE
jgi:flagellar hook-basal body complex protein FliE